MFIAQRAVGKFDPNNDTDVEEVKNALLSSKDVRNMFEKDGKVESGFDFYAVLDSALPFPCIFLTW